MALDRIAGPFCTVLVGRLPILSELFGLFDTEALFSGGGPTLLLSSLASSSSRRRLFPAAAGESVSSHEATIVVSGEVFPLHFRGALFFGRVAPHYLLPLQNLAHASGPRISN